MSTDIAIIGGGIAGLWLLNRLRMLGYDAHLYEKTALGNGQTIACQGIIHGGIKYRIGGPLPDTLAAMPKRWTDCFAGRGEIDLKDVEILCPRHELHLKSGVMDFPLWKFQEPVIDIKSLLANLAKNCAGFVHLGEPQESKVTIYTCGIGNEGHGPHTQRRPLRMFMVRNMNAAHYAHYIEASDKPRVTITTHFHQGEMVWYLGGNIAEKAVGMDDKTALAWALSEMRQLFPDLKIDWAKRGWAIHDVDRAEPANDLVLPNKPVFSTAGNTAVAWPIKLALAPILADSIIEWIEQAKLLSYHGIPKPVYGDAPPIAQYPWETAKWHSSALT